MERPLKPGYLRYRILEAGLRTSLDQSEVEVRTGPDCQIQGPDPGPDPGPDTESCN